MTSTEDSPSDGNRTEPDVGAPSSAAAVRPPERKVDVYGYSRLSALSSYA